MKGLCLNIILFAFELIGIILSILSNHKFLDFKYYTNLSNVLCLFSSLFFIVCYFYKSRALKKIMLLLKLISTTGLAITIITVLFVLGPNGARNSGINGYLNYLFPKGLLFLHLLCPILSIISFIRFENNSILNKPIYYILSACYTFIYGIIVITLVYFKIISAPYFFLDSINLGYLLTFILGLIFVAVSSLISFLLLYLNKRRYSKEIMFE